LGMLQEPRNDTILKRLDQPVGMRMSDSIHTGVPRLVIPESMRVPPLKANDTLNRDFFPVLQKQHSFKRLVNKGDTELVIIPPIQPERVVLFTEEPYKPQIILPERKIERNSADWQIAVFILALVLLGSVRLFFSNYLVQLLSALINNTTASRMFRERSLSLVHASFRLDVLFYFIFSLFVFQTLEVFGILFYPNDLISYFIIFAGLLVYFGLKKFIYYVQGKIARSGQETAEFLFNMNIYNRMTGLFLLPVCLVVAFTPLAEPKFVIFAGFCIIGIFYFLLLLRGAKILIRKQFSIFYLILYLCTLEIVPLLFIYRMMPG
jgi:hypothetical protein